MQSPEFWKDHERAGRLSKELNELKEEANFWDSHDAIADVDEGTLVGFHKANKSGILTVRFEEEDLRTIRAKAFKKGIGPTTSAPYLKAVSRICLTELSKILLS